MDTGRTGLGLHHRQAGRHFPQGPVGNGFGHGDIIFFFMVERGVTDFVMQSTIVGQKQQAGGILIQSANRINPLGYIHQIEYDFFTRMTAAGDIVRGLVQRDVNQRLGILDRLAVDLHLIHSGIDFRTEFNDNLVVDGNPPGLNVFFSLAAGTDTGCGKKFLKAH
jgi:hypothetical protein